MGTPDRSGWLRSALVAAALIAVPTGAGATVPDLYGLGGRSLGMGGGGVALVDDGAAAMVNPAGLSRSRTPSAAIAFSAAIESFQAVPPLWWDTNRDGVIDENDPALDYDVGVDDALGLHFYLGKDIGETFGLAIAGYVPVNRLLRLETFEPSLPNYLIYANRPQRYALAIGLGGRVVKGLHIGASVDFVPRARLEVLMTADLGVTGDVDPDGNVEDLFGEAVIDVHELSLDLVPGFAPIFGIQAEIGEWIPALDGLVIGAMYRGRVGLPIEVVLDAQVNLEVTDVGDLEPFVTALVANAGLNLFDHYVPRTVCGSVAYKKPLFAAYADVRWTQWSQLVLNVTRLEYATVDAPLIDLPEDAIQDGNDFEATFRSTVSARAGVEWSARPIEVASKWQYWQFTLRGGLGWEPTPLVSQTTASALMDANRILFTLGAGVETMDPLDLIKEPMRLEVFGQYHYLLPWTLPRSAAEPTAGYPREGDALSVGGRILVVGAQISFHYR